MQISGTEWRNLEDLLRGDAAMLALCSLVLLLHCLCILRYLARFVMRNNHAIYFWTYWSTDAGYALLGIGVMYEVSKRLLGRLGRSWWPRLLFPRMIKAVPAMA